jgi:FkbM family methyltransferase
MKRIIKNMFRTFGFEITKLGPGASRKTVHTGKLTLYKTKTGNYYLPTDAYQDDIANTIKKGLIFDIAIYDMAKKFIQPGTTALDVGSNFGQMAVLMSKLTGVSGIVHAFDADDFVYKVLEKNAKENSPNIITHFGAVHNKSNETLYFPVQDFKKYGTYGSFGIDYVQGKGRPVKTITIDEIEFTKPVSFMKIDVQGGDLFAMQGAVKTIAKYKMPIIFEYEYAFEEEQNLDFQEYVDFVKSINYKFARVINGQNYLILPIQ